MSIVLFRTSLVAVLAASTLFAVRPVSALQYTVVPLGTLGGTSSQAYGINANGQVVGGFVPSGNVATNGYPPDHAFVYSNGTMTDLGTFGGTNSCAYGINASGQVVGWASTSTGITQAFLYSNGNMTDLSPVGAYGQAYAINASGQVVGQDGAAHAFLYSNGTMQDLSTLGGIYSWAFGINNNGQIVGQSITGTGDYRAFLYSNGSMADIGTLGGPNSYGYGINASGQIVGQSATTAGPTHGFLYGGGGFADVGTFGGDYGPARGINASGQVVGWADLSAGGQDGFLYENGTMYDLNTLLVPGSGSGWTITDAEAINDNGWIAATGFNPAVNGGNPEALLLTPEPASLGILVLGVVGLLVQRSRRSCCGRNLTSIGTFSAAMTAFSILCQRRSESVVIQPV